MPIYVGGQSADVWASQHLFELGPDGAPQTVSGVPPDAFSDTGQLWGSPLYDWPVCLPLWVALPVCCVRRPASFNYYLGTNETVQAGS